jgi:hypothetical protein
MAQAHASAAQALAQARAEAAEATKAHFEKEFALTTRIDALERRVAASAASAAAATVAVTVFDIWL